MADPTELDGYLEEFRSTEDLASLVLLVDDLAAMQVLAVWPYVSKHWQRPAAQDPTEKNALWGWLWSGCIFIEKELAEMADLSTGEAVRKLTKLKAARLVFPDGTVNAQAQALIRTHIGRSMK
jgi:hypothetical protein